MFICSCNGLTDKDVQAAVVAGATRPTEIYAAKKCRAQCGNCVPGVVCLLRQALQEQRARLADAVIHTPSMVGVAREAACLS
ncbi:(2Fe-2S)-binding protein [Acetobacter sacchari]|uniref:Bacterioferritin-associated ferredoxin n=1 Tax=Acetobacter sacchari TaxID=2661687 RepID=A0ABS3LTM5_9PROT|nr:(2Fe-2S)-binding protein [Acetobacter sacchari]MBO1359254.1 (2Fe-2S)-binding protein [Acetobacter sacchari]